SDAGRSDEALEAYRQALANQERLARANPSILAYPSALGGTLNNMALIEMKRERWREARDLLEQAIGHQRKATAAMPGHPTYAQYLTNHLHNLRKVHRALNQPAAEGQVVRALASLAQGKPSELYNLACDLVLSLPTARGAERPALAAEAVRLLEEAIAAGWN